MWKDTRPFRYRYFFHGELDLSDMALNKYVSFLGMKAWWLSLPNIRKWKSWPFPFSLKAATWWFPLP